MIEKIKEAIKRIDEISKKKKITVISHFDTDGITSAAIFSRALQRWGKKFSLQITKGLEEDYINKLPEDNLLIFLDLASGSLNYLANKKTEVIIFDHHEIPLGIEIPKNVLMVNPLLENSEQISGAGICYLFAKEISHDNKDLATLAVLGMVGDIHDQNIGKTYNEIIKDSETIVKRGLLIYPSTRPINKTLEYSSQPYISGVSGSYKGVLELLKEANLSPENGRYRAIYELNEGEMSSLITAIMLRCKNQEEIEKMIGNLYLVRFQNKLEDARELSALINACSRMDHPYISLGFCLGNKDFRQKAEKIYMEYKQNLVAALKYIEEAEQIKGKNYFIINAKDKIKDTIIGTVTSIISRSPAYVDGTIFISLAYNNDKIKVSARIKGNNSKNVREVLVKTISSIGGEVGGHQNAAGCLIAREKEEEFMNELKKTLEIEMIKV